MIPATSADMTASKSTSEGVGRGSNPILDAIARENEPHLPNPADQQAYAVKHGNRATQGWKQLSDIQVASRARMLMRDDWSHELVCTSVRDRICALVVEKQDLLEALEGLERRIAEAWPELINLPPMQTARVALVKAKGEPA